MSVFKSEDEVNQIFGTFLREITSDPALGPKFLASNTSFKICFTDPEANLFVDATKDPVEVEVGDTAATSDADVELMMTADDGHKFWLGDMNLMGALARRKIKPKGEVTKLVGLLPTLQQAYGVYRQHAINGGLPVG
ncbi:SCP2 sterol-binding domain-containing protein [Mycolicibacterium hodleri]|uniref:SCP2 domain-containing protein n=1 Tax=Mycolicibacterium hodleri TaxID=49897 RepID=A0A502E7G6_9MYCO|nr:SCP2 sterol-binding domain-containing protein [Mycolicibacterium hodleri]TPG32391.1 hypothetical protein EAH80_19080 [Mycolicibacterium hodleri]